MPKNSQPVDIAPTEGIMSNEKLFKISVSKAKTYDQCLAKFNYAYNLFLPRKQWAHFDFGHMLHQTLEEFHQAYIGGSTEALHVVMGRAYKNALKKYALKLDTDARKEAYGIVDAYLQKITAERETIKNVIAVEKRFTLQLTDKISLTGAIDRVEYDKDGVLTVGDYKTTKKAEHLEDDSFQLLTYAYALLCEDPSITKVRGAYIMLRHNFDRIETEFNLDDMQQVKQIFQDYAKKIEETKIWTGNPSRLCDWCDWKDICAEGKAYLANLNKTKSKYIKHGQTEW